VSAGAGREKCVVSRKRYGESAAVEQIEHVSAPHSGRSRICGRAVFRGQSRIGAMLEKQFDIRERISTGDRVMQRTPAPIREKIWIGAVIEQPGDAIIVLPVELANQHRYH